MLKTIFSAITATSLSCATASANTPDFENLFTKVLPPSIAFASVGSPACQGYGLGLSRTDIILRTREGTLYVPYEIPLEGNLQIHTNDVKYIPCPA